MKTATVIFSPQDVNELINLNHLFEHDKASLVNEVNKFFSSLIFENTYTLHPRDILIFGEHEIDSFLKYLNNGDTSIPAELGMRRARQGLGRKCILGLGLLLRQLIIEKLNISEIANSALFSRAIEHYMIVYIDNYCHESASQMLRQQKELRQALSTALVGQRRELELHQHALNTSINAVIFTDLESKITYINPAFLSLWGYSEISEILGSRNIQSFFRDRLDSIFQTLKDQGHWFGEIQAVRKNGTYFDVEMSASHIKAEDDQFIGIMASFVDITERKRLETQFRQTQKMEALGQLAGGITHDFNNMLTAVSGYLQLILMDTDKDTPLFKDLIQVKIAVDRGAGLTKRLRYFASGAAGERVPTNLNSLIKESYELLRHTFPLNIEIKLNLQSDLWIINADPSQLSHVIMNFCVNARDAIGEKNLSCKNDDSLKGRVILETQNLVLDEKAAIHFFNLSPGRYIRLRVIDNGIGMSQDILDKLYEPFFTTKKMQKGTGLGLSINYGIIQKHQGFIDVHSEVGKGSAFEIYLPVPQIEPVVLNDEQDIPVLSSKKETILVVDDETQILALIERLLVRCGYRVILAENGRHAITIYENKKNSIDLVILDLIMPEVDGKDCLTKLQKMNPAIKVILTTGFTADSSAHELIKDGVLGVIEKPFELPQLSQIIYNAFHSE
jgi:two-component system, cell cycle sensor histidine kinase and response regulator CckA